MAVGDFYRLFGVTISNGLVLQKCDFISNWVRISYSTLGTYFGENAVRHVSCLDERALLDEPTAG
jgi:hypothetical protein